MTLTKQFVDALEMNNYFCTDADCEAIRSEWVDIMGGYGRSIGDDDFEKWADLALSIAIKAVNG